MNDREHMRSFKSKKTYFILAGLILLILWIIFLCWMYPYRSTIYWKIHDIFHTKKVTLIHDNVYDEGVEGIIEDLDKKLRLPDKLYVSSDFMLTFDRQGKIKSFSTFLYGKKRFFGEKTYLIDYDVSKNEKIIVHTGGQAMNSYKKEMLLEPLCQIMKRADIEETVKKWPKTEETYELLYYGKRSFATAEGLKYLIGDADGDKVEKGESSKIYSLLKQGGEVTGYEVSLHIPEKDEEITPVRYIMEPTYTSQDQLKKVQEKQQIEESKQEDEWSVDDSDGSMYYFLNDNIGWRMIVTDAACGSRFYELENTKDGGNNWETMNSNPFSNELGVAEGLLFYDENHGFAGLTGASWSNSAIYRTQDGGRSFLKCEFPMEMVTELPKSAESLGLEVEDYQFINMPEKEGNVYKVLVTVQAYEEEGIVFRSDDYGKTWIYDGVKQ